MASKRKPHFDKRTEVKRLARERVGAVPASRAIEPDSRRKRPKHKLKISEEGPE